MKFVMKRARWMALGAGALWILDPERGPQRRAMLKEKVDAAIEKGGNLLGGGADRPGPLPGARPEAASSPTRTAGPATLDGELLDPLHEHAATGIVTGAMADDLSGTSTLS